GTVSSIRLLGCRFPVPPLPARAPLAPRAEAIGPPDDGARRHGRRGAPGRPLPVGRPGRTGPGPAGSGAGPRTLRRTVRRGTRRGAAGTGAVLRDWIMARPFVKKRAAMGVAARSSRLLGRPFA